jgi:hypothetical protein
MRLFHTLLAFGLLTSAACHPGPVVGGGPKASVGGTIAGIVSTDTKAAVPGRKVSAVVTAPGTRYDATSGGNGGSSIKVPDGT